MIGECWSVAQGRRVPMSCIHMHSAHNHNKIDTHINFAYQKAIKVDALWRRNITERSEHNKLKNSHTYNNAQWESLFLSVFDSSSKNCTLNWNTISQNEKVCFSRFYAELACKFIDFGTSERKYKIYTEMGHLFVSISMNAPRIKSIRWSGRWET